MTCAISSALCVCKAQFFIWLSSILTCTLECLPQAGSNFQCSVAARRWCCLSFACAQNCGLCLPSWLYFSVNVATLRKRRTVQWISYFLFFHALTPFRPSRCEGLLTGKGFGCCCYRCFRRLVAESRKKTFTKLIKISILLHKGNCKSSDNRFAIARPEQYLETRATGVLQDDKRKQTSSHANIWEIEIFFGAGF